MGLVGQGWLCLSSSKTKERVKVQPSGGKPLEGFVVFFVDKIVHIVWISVEIEYIIKYVCNIKREMPER